MKGCRKLQWCISLLTLSPVYSFPLWSGTGCLEPFDNNVGHQSGHKVSWNSLVLECKERNIGSVPFGPGVIFSSPVVFTEIKLGMFLEYAKEQLPLPLHPLMMDKVLEDVPDQVMSIPGHTQRGKLKLNTTSILTNASIFYAASTHSAQTQFLEVCMGKNWTVRLNNCFQHTE